MKYTFHTNRSFCFNESYQFYMIKWDMDKKTKWVLGDSGWIETPENAPANPLIINVEDMILLANELWENKIKPPEFFNSVGEHDAIKKHLEDMRQIAFKKLGVDKPVRTDD